MSGRIDFRFKSGQLVEVHRAHKVRRDGDQWGTVVGVEPDAIYVRLLRTGRVLPFLPSALIRADPLDTCGHFQRDEAGCCLDCDWTPA